MMRRAHILVLLAGAAPLAAGIQAATHGREKGVAQVLFELSLAVAAVDGVQVYHLTEELRRMFPPRNQLVAEHRRQSVFDDQIFKLTEAQKVELETQLQEPYVAHALAMAQTGGWYSCAREKEQCHCMGLVRFGHPHKKQWSEEVTVNGTVECSARHFDLDSTVGISKECECKRSSFALAKEGNSVSLLQEAFIFLLRFLGSISEHPPAVGQSKPQRQSMLPFTGHRAYEGIALWVHRQITSPKAGEEVLERFWVDKYIQEVTPLVPGPACLEWDHDFGYVNRIPQCSDKYSIEYKEGAMIVSGHSLYGDIYRLGDAGIQFNLIVATQVLEHIEHPDEALRSVFAATKPGGVLLYTGPHLSQFHKVPVDYNRYTRMKVLNMLREAGFCVPLDFMAGGGDFVFAAAAFMGMRRSDFTLEEMEQGFHKGYGTISDGALGIYALGFKPPHKACLLPPDYTTVRMRPAG